MATVKAFKFAGVTESLKINRGILGVSENAQTHIQSVQNHDESRN
jgi:hypothetical protein